MMVKKYTEGVIQTTTDKYVDIIYENCFNIVFVCFYGIES